MIFNILYLQVDNEYSDSAIDYTCANTKSEWITITAFECAKIGTQILISQQKIKSLLSLW